MILFGLVALCNELARLFAYHLYPHPLESIKLVCFVPPLNPQDQHPPPPPVLPIVHLEYSKCSVSIWRKK